MLRAFRFSLRLLPLLLAAPLLAFLQPGVAQATVGNEASADHPVYTADGQLRLPERYREWIYLTSGLDMSYSPQPGSSGHSMFDNVFINPSSYKAFERTGTWPDGTTLVLEVRGAETGVSIDRHGKTQSAELMGLEVHVKDTRLPGGWGFFQFNNPTSAKLTPRPADCYSCHEAHGAVDTTFVQFYPTLLGLARAKQTLSPAYRKESAPAAQ
jgi:Cytochrome P460